jgi:hypothetical protein
LSTLLVSLARHIRIPSLSLRRPQAGSLRRRKLEARQSLLGTRLFPLEASRRKGAPLSSDIQSFVFSRILHSNRSTPGSIETRT